MATNNATNGTIPFTVPSQGTGAQSFTPYAPITSGTTTTGAFQSVASVGTAAQVLTSNGTGSLPTFQATPTAGDFIKISSQAASSSSSIDFLSLTGTYLAYFFVFVDVIPANSGDSFWVRVSDDNTNFISSASAYRYDLMWGATTTTGTVTSAGDTQILLNNRALATTANYGANGNFRIFGQGVVTQQFMTWENVYQTTDASNLSENTFGCAQAINAASAIQGIRFMFSTGAIASGTFNLYGITA